MSYFGGGGGGGGGGGHGGGGGRGGGAPSTALLTGPQLFVNSQQLQPQNYSFPSSEPSHSQSGLQLNGGTSLLLQPTGFGVTDGLGVHGIGQLITQAGSLMMAGNVLMAGGGDGGGGGGQSKQRVFTGTVTKIHDNFGFIDEEVFFQMGVVKGPILPKEGDRVLVEADFNPSMPFKWNATRVQIVNMGSSSQGQGGGQGAYYSSASKQVPPPPAISRQQQQQGPGLMYGPPTGQGSNRGLSDQQLMRSRPPPQMSSHFSDPSSGLLLPPLMSKLESSSSRKRSRSRSPVEPRRERGERRGSRERDRDRRRSRSRERKQLRSRSRSKSPFQKEKERFRIRRSPSPPPPPKRERERRGGSPRERRGSPRDRDRVPRDRERDKSGSRDKERERKRSRSPKREKRRSRDRERGERERERAERGSERVRRSRSRETNKSSEGHAAKGPSSIASEDLKGGIKPLMSMSTSKNKYVVEVPRFSLNCLELRDAELRERYFRYKGLYVPSDFFLARATWMEAFPLEKPFSFPLSAGEVCIMGRKVERLPSINFSAVEGAEEREALERGQEKFNQVPSVHPAPDASNMFSVKVMLLSMPSIESIFRKSGFVLDTEKEDGVVGKGKDGDFSPLQRILKFVVGVKTGSKNKGELLALGGAWSPSLDGPDPQSNPHVLINTAVRTVKAQANMDLTRCTKWYRFMEIYYRRSNGNVETVVYLLPDLSTAAPSASEWTAITSSYRVALKGKDKKPKTKTSISTSSPDQSEIAKPKVESEQEKNGTEEKSGVQPADQSQDTCSSGEKNDKDLQPPEVEKQKGSGEDGSNQSADGAGDNLGVEVMEVVELDGGAAAESITDIEAELAHLMDHSDDGDKLQIVESQEEGKEQSPQPEEKEANGGDPDIYEDIVEVPQEKGEEAQEKGPLEISVDVKGMNVAKLREELAARNLNTKGLKAQLVARLQEALDSQAAAEKLSVPPTVNENEGGEAEGKEDGELNTTIPLLTIVDPSSLMDTTVELEDEILPTPTNQEDDEVSQVQIVNPKDEMEDQDEEEEPEEIGDGKYPIIKEGMSPEEVKLWERRYSFPKTPKILAFPSENAESKHSYFDVSMEPLSTLRDYRTQDKREESFEVSLFAEFFKEMLTRDAGFLIYSEIVKQAKAIKDQEKESAVGEDGVEPPAPKRRKGSELLPLPKDGDAKVRTVEPLKLLAFTFFDEHHAGYITEEHMEEIVSCLGLGVTRHQVQKLLRKVKSGGGIEYRRWTDRSLEQLEAEDADAEDESLLAEVDKGLDERQFVQEITKGNNELLPLFTYNQPIVCLTKEGELIPLSDSAPSTDKEEILVTVDGQVVNVREVQSQKEDAEKHKLQAEAEANVLKISLTEAKNQASEYKKSNHDLTKELKAAKEQVKKLKSSEKSNMEDLQTFKEASERFAERVKHLIKFPYTGPKPNSVIVQVDKSKNVNSSTNSDIVLVDEESEEKNKK